VDCSKAVPVSGVAEEYAYVTAQRCPACGGRWAVCRRVLLEDAQGRHYDQIDVACRRCAATQAFLFDIQSFFPSAQG